MSSRAKIEHALSAASLPARVEYVRGNVCGRELCDYWSVEFDDADHGLCEGTVDDVLAGIAAIAQQSDKRGDQK